MPSDIGDLVQRLEAAWVEPGGADLTQLASLLAERQRVLAELQNADTSGLDPETRSALAERVRRVKERDAKLLAHLENRRLDAAKELEQAIQGRTAARGYRAAEGPPKRGIHEVG